VVIEVIIAQFAFHPPPLGLHRSRGLRCGESIFEDWVPLSTRNSESGLVHFVNRLKRPEDAGQSSGVSRGSREDHLALPVTKDSGVGPLGGRPRRGLNASVTAARRSMAVTMSATRKGLAKKSTLG